MLRRIVVLVALVIAGPACVALPLGSAHAIVVDEATGEVLLEKDTTTPAPIASLTKLLTAMVVLDAQQDPAEVLRITQDDVDHLKGTRSGVAVGKRVTRGTLIELALLVSDNRAASALARNHPGGLAGFHAAVRRKIGALGLRDTVIDEPTGLSPNNRASARDMIVVLRAAAEYPAIADITSKRQHTVVVGGRRVEVRNTNRLVGTPGWNILLSKTGFTNEAGRCVSMRLQAAGRTVMVVLMGALGAADRTMDAMNIRRWLANSESPMPTPRRRVNSPLRTPATEPPALLPVVSEPAMLKAPDTDI